MKRTIESNKIKRLQSELHMIDAANTVENKHTFFLDSEKDMKNFDLAKHLQTHPALLGRRTNRTRLDDLAKMNLANVDEKVNTKSSVFFCAIVMLSFCYRLLIIYRNSEKMPIRN